MPDELRTDPARLRSDIHSTGALWGLMKEYLVILGIERGLSENTVFAYRRDLEEYLIFLKGRPPTPALVDKFLVELHRKGRASTTIARKLAALRGFHRHLIAEGKAEDDPTRLTETPRSRMTLPKALDVHEAIRLVETPPTDTPLGRRDRALLETLYGSAVRVSELVALNLTDLDLDTAGTIVTGKGGRQRLVLLGKPAVQAIRTYLPDRLDLCGERRDHDILYVNARGAPLTRQGVFGIVRKHAIAAGIPYSRISPHVLRHSAATHMVEGGADLRTVQQFLGHAGISTTQVYTRMSLQHLQEVYVESHPRALRG
ncbi:MAG: tyrosine recombinase [Acidimicrobiia bacterium]|nr:tyrosine recombinase [Acidimicrobiia bacterium]MXZ07278.1 tyrosine recombinase [Acidimicrobiia bacterium]